MKKIYWLIFSIFSLQSYAQDLHIYYNVYKDSLWYEKNGKPTTDLNVRKGKQVYFHVTEYNNYIYRSEIETSFHSVQPPGYENESNNFLGLMPSLINSLIPGGSAVLPLLNAPIFGNILSALAPTDTTTSARGENEDITEYKEKLLDIENKREEINNLLNELNKRIRSEKLLKGDLGFINTISTNPNIAPSLIKSMLNDYFSEALMIKPNQMFQLKDVAELNTKMDEISGLKSDISIRSKEYESKLIEFKKLHRRLKNSDHGIDALYPLMKQFEQQEPAIEKLTTDIVNTLTTDSSSTKFDFNKAIQQHYLKYVELQNNNFSIVYNSEANSRFILFELNVYLRDSTSTSNLTAEKNLHLYKSLKVKVNTYGGFGLVTSVGIQGAGYKNSPESYYIANNILQSEAKDKYVPFVGSMFNLSYQLSSSISPALSFGIGIPLSNKDVIENLSYLLGPAIIIGKSKNLVINGGFIFSKIQRLARNLKVGDSIDIGGGTIPTSGKFERGYFIGLSYNISGH